MQIDRHIDIDLAAKRINRRIRLEVDDYKTAQRSSVLGKNLVHVDLLDWD